MGGVGRESAQRRERSGPAVRQWRQKRIVQRRWFRQTILDGQRTARGQRGFEQRRASFLSQITAAEQFRHLELARGVGAVRLGPGAFLGRERRRGTGLRFGEQWAARAGRHGNQSRRSQSLQRLVRGAVHYFE